MSTEEKKPGSIQSLARASAILREVVGQRDGIGLAQLSKAVGLHSSTAFHLVKTLVSLGYVRQDEATKAYRVGPLVFELAASAFDETEMASVSAPYLHELAMRTGETSHLAIRTGTDIIVVAKSDGTGAFRIAERTGVTRPAHATALGKILLAAMKPANLDLFLAQIRLQPLTPRTITDVDRLKLEIESVRRTGIAYDEGEFHPEIRCVAVPVSNFSSQVVGALGMSTPIWRLSLNDLQDKTTTLREVAEQLSSSFGHKGAIQNGAGTREGVGTAATPADLPQSRLASGR
jgi:IclR family transcriptional regulator, KDG regulon repressor